MELIDADYLIMILEKNKKEGCVCEALTKEEAIDSVIEIIANGIPPEERKSITKELKERRSEINQIDTHQFRRTEVLKILDKRISELSELKGENNGT